jgi:hypothetical protein
MVFTSLTDESDAQDEAGGAHEQLEDKQSNHLEESATRRVR